MMLAHLAQITVSMRPSTVRSTETGPANPRPVRDRPRPGCCRVADVERSHIEAFKVWQHMDMAPEVGPNPSTDRPLRAPDLLGGTEPVAGAERDDGTHDKGDAHGEVGVAG